MLRSRFEISRSWTILLCSSNTKRQSKSIVMPRIYVASRSKRNSYKRVDPKQCTTWPSLGNKSLQQIRKNTCIEVQVQSLFKFQTESWIRIVNGVEKYVRESMRIQEEERASGKPAAKARPILMPSSTNGLDFTPTEQRKWIDIETQESKDPSCFQVSKFITRLLRHSQKVNREEVAGVHYDQIMQECKKNHQTIQDIGQTKWCSNLQFFRIGQLTNGHQFWRKVEDRRKGFDIASTRTILRNSCTFAQSNDIQEVQSILHCKTMYCYQKVSPSIFITSENGKEFRSIVNHGLIPGVSLKTGRQAVFFTVVNPMDSQDGLGETLCDLSQGRSAPYKNTWKHFQDTIFWCNLKLAQQRRLQFYQTRSNAVILYDTLLAEFIEKAICMKTKDQLYQRESVILRPRVALEANSQSGSQDLLVQEARSSWESQQDAKSYGATLSNTADYRITGISISTVKLQDAWRQNNVTKLVECSRSISMRNNSLKTWVKSRRSTGSARNHKNCSKMWIKHRSSNFARILQNFNVLIAIPLRKSGSFVAVAGEIWSTSGVPHQPRRLIATCFNPGFVIKKNSSRGPKHGQSERQIMFVKAKEMFKKQDKKNRVAIRRYFQGGMHKKRIPKVTGGAQHWRKRKSCFTIAWLLKDTTIQLHELSRSQNARHWVLRFECRKMQDACLAETQKSLVPIHPQHQQSQRQNQQFEGGENLGYCVDRITGWRCYREPRGHPQAASSSTSQWPTSQWQTCWSSWQPTSSEKWWWFRIPGQNSGKSTGGVDRTPTHNTHLCSTVWSQARNANHALGSSNNGLQCHLCSPEKNLSSSVAHVSPFVVLSLAVYHEHIIFLTHSSFYHDTRTRRTPSTSRTSPSYPSRQAAPSRITLAWKPAEWRKTAHNIFHMDCSIFFSKTRFVSKHSLRILRKRLQIVIVFLWILDWEPQSFFHGNDWWSLCRGAAFTGIVAALSIIARLLWLLGGCTLGRIAQGLSWQWVFAHLQNFVR